MAIVISQACFPSHGADPRLTSARHPSSGGGWSPSGSPAGHWSADTITGLSDGDPVGTWPDQSGNGNDITCSLAAWKPTYKTNIKNSLPVVRWDSDYLLGSSLAATQPFSAFLVLVWSNTTGRIFPFSGETVTCGFYTDPSDPSLFLDAETIAGEGVDTGKDIVVDTWAVVTTVLNGASSYARVNGSQSGNVDPGSNNLDNFLLGKHSGCCQFYGDIAEALLYDSEEPPASNESGLNAKWAVY